MQPEIGAILDGKVTGITKFGAFVELSANVTGMVHISEVAPTYVKEISQHLKEGQIVRVKVMAVDASGKIALSIKKALPEAAAPVATNRGQNSVSASRGQNFAARGEDSGNSGFEDMLNKFKRKSDERMGDLKRTIESKRGSGGRRGGRP